jgi:hypothetical protein
VLVKELVYTSLPADSVAIVVPLMAQRRCRRP